MNLDDIPRTLLHLFEGLRHASETMWIGVVVVLLALALTVVAWSHFRLRRRFEEVRKVLSQQWNDSLAAQRTLHELQQAVEVRQRLEEQVAAVEKQQEQLMLRDGAGASYVQAIRQAQRGSSVEELMSTYDLSLAEAELIVALHVRERPSG